MISRPQLTIAVAVFAWSGAALAAPTLGAETQLDSPVPNTQAAGLPATTTTASATAVVWDGTQYVAAFATAAYPASIGAVRISDTGALLDPFGVDVALNSFYVGAAAGAGITLIATSGSAPATSHAAVVRIASDGTLMDATPIVLPGSTGATNVAASFDGTNFLVSTTWGPSTLESSTLAWRVTAAGAVLDANPLSVTSGTGTVVASGFDGTSHVVLTSSNGSGFMATRVSAGGAVAPAGAIDLTTISILNPSGTMACDGATGCVAVWTGQNGQTGRFVVGSAAIGSTTLNTISTASTVNTTFGSPAIAWDGSHYVAVWPTGGQAMAVHLDATGTPMEPAPIAIGLEGSPAATGVAAAPDGILSMWQGSSDVVDGLLAPAGLSGTDGGTFPISVGPNKEEAASAASNGDGYAVAITTQAAGAEAIAVSRVSAQGAPLDAPLLSFGTGADPAVASAGGAYLVTWLANFGVSGALLPATGGRLRRSLRHWHYRQSSHARRGQHSIERRERDDAQHV